MKSYQITSVDATNGSITSIIKAMSYEEAIHVAYQTMRPSTYVNGGFTSLTVTPL